MAQAHITWSPSPTNSTEQKVQYRAKGAENWITFSTVSATTSQETITNLDPNIIYEFRVLSNCTSGGDAISATITKVSLVCPLISTTSSSQAINYSFAHQGGDITKYQMDLLKANGVSVITSINHTAPFSGQITGTFAGLNPQTNYNIRLTIFAGASYEFSKTCGLVPVATAAAETCTPPTNVNVVIS